MPTNYTTRFLIIGGILLAAIWSIFPGAFKGNFDPDLKPGIDMVGGTSLLYEIRTPPGSKQYTGDLAVEMMNALKRRIDPEGVRNLIWRPQGNTRLEIQMPSSGKSGESAVKRAAYADALEARIDWRRRGLARSFRWCGVRVWHQIKSGGWARRTGGGSWLIGGSVY